MSTRVVLALLAVLLALLAGACGGGDEPELAPAPAGTEAPTADPAPASSAPAEPEVPPVTQAEIPAEAGPFVEDFIALTSVIREIAATTNAQARFNDVLDRAGEIADAEASSTLLTQELPVIVPDVIDENERTDAGLQEIELSTAEGEALREIQLRAARGNAAVFSDLLADVTDDPGQPWDALTVWVEENNAHSRTTGEEYSTWLAGLPASYRAALDAIGAGGDIAAS